MNPMDKLGYIILELSKTLRQESGLLRLKAAASLERGEMLLERYGICK